MKTVIIVSKCIRVIKLKNSEIWFEFHFKGVCSGSVLRKVLLISSVGAVIEKNEEYLIYVRTISCIEGVLRGEIIKSKALSECWDRS
jgi:hypothetical protein